MANYFVTYDLNGKTPTHAQMDEHIKKLGGQCIHRVVETVWYVKYAGTQEQLYNHVSSILSANDRLLVVTASNCTWRNLLIADQTLLNCWTS